MQKGVAKGRREPGLDGTVKVTEQNVNAVCQEAPCKLAVGRLTDVTDELPGSCCLHSEQHWEPLLTAPHPRTSFTHTQPPGGVKALSSRAMQEHSSLSNSSARLKAKAPSRH